MPPPAKTVPPPSGASQQEQENAAFCKANPASPKCAGGQPQPPTSANEKLCTANPNDPVCNKGPQPGVTRPPGGAGFVPSICAQNPNLPQCQGAAPGGGAIRQPPSDPLKPAPPGTDTPPPPGAPPAAPPPLPGDGSLCPDGQIRTETNECVDQCPEGTSIYQGLYDDGCVAECPASMLPDANNICQPCNGIILEGQCLSQCPEGTLKLIENNQVQCVAQCPADYLIEFNRCVQQCSPGYNYIQDGQCLTSCPQGTIPHEGQCLSACPEGLIEFNYQCLNDCPNGSVLWNGQCVFEGNCSGGQVRVPTGEPGGECMDSCPENMVERAGGCIGQVPCYNEGGYTYEGQCLEQCPQGTSLLDGTCYARCPQGPENLGIIDGQCAACPEGQFGGSDGQCTPRFYCGGGGLAYIDGECRPYADVSTDEFVNACAEAIENGNELGTNPYITDTFGIDYTGQSPERQCRIIVDNICGNSSTGPLCEGRQPLCGENEYLSTDGECVQQCPEGQYSQGGDQCTAACQSSATPVGNECRCPDHQSSNGNSCVSECPAGTTRRDGVCEPDTICPEGQLGNAGQCVQSCPDGTVTNDGQCEQCPGGQAEFNGQCVEAGNCPAGQVQVGQLPYGSCQDSCPDGYVNHVGNCIVTWNCAGRGGHIGDGQCLEQGECAGGQVMRGDECVAPPPDTDTPPPAGEEQPPVDDQQPPGEEQPPVEGEQPPGDTQQPPEDVQPPPDETPPPAEEEQPPADGSPPPAENEQPPAEGEQPPDTGTPPPDTGTPPPPPSAGSPPAETKKRPSVDTITGYRKRVAARGPLGIVIANSRYKSKVIKNSRHAAPGATAFVKFLRSDMRLPARRVLSRNNMRRADFVSLFGRKGGPAGRLKTILAGAPASELIIYYSGRAMPIEGGRDAVLLTRDAEFKQPAKTGYRLSELYKRLASLGVQRLRLYLDTAFSIPSNAQPAANAPAFKPVQISPALGPLGKLTPAKWVVISAGTGTQATYADPKAPRSAFTDAVLRGLRGYADRIGEGNKNGAVTAGELEAFLRNELHVVVNNATGGTQRPSLFGNASIILTADLIPRPAPATPARLPSSTVKPSFDCAKAYAKAEKAICGSPAIATLDNVMVGLYKKVRRARKGAARNALVAQQKTWLKQRNACGSDIACLAQRYGARIQQLQ